MILDKLADSSMTRVERAKLSKSLCSIRSEALALGNDGSYPFYNALKKPGMSFICEVKKASPSKGLIAREFPYVSIAKEYEAAGASAISVLTEPNYFYGHDDYLREIVENVSIPVLRKDFTVDAYQIYEAKLLGASAVLLICTILTNKQISEYLKLAKTLGLSALVETHNEAEVRIAVDAGAKIIGVNNRDLRDFSVDIENSIRLRKMIPEDVVFVSESGIKGKELIKRLYENRTDAVLVGESLMRSKDKKAKLDELKSEIPV